MDYSTERPKFPDFKPPPKWNRDAPPKIERYQLFPLYVISNWCVHADGSPLNVWDRYRVAKLCLFNDVGGKVHVIEKLADPKHKWAVTMAELVTPHREKLSNNTQKLLDKNREKLGKLSLDVSLQRV